MSAKIVQVDTAVAGAPPAVLSEDYAHKAAVDHPSHYNMGKFEVIDVIDDWQLDFYDGNVVKYVARAKHKGKELEDLEKALWYLTRKVEQVRAAQAPAEPKTLAELPESLSKYRNLLKPGDPDE